MNRAPFLAAMALVLAMMGHARPGLAAGDENTLVVPVYPGAPWELTATPLAGDPLQREAGQATVYDEAIVRDARIEDVEDLAIATPGLQISGFSNRLTLRGIGAQLLLTTASTPVGLYIDDVFVPSPAAFNFDLFDIERLEILRGPQGYRRGRGSVAGDIRIESRGAQPENSGEIEASYGSFNHRQIRARANVTSEDKAISNRLAVTATRRDGTVRNTFDGERISTRENWGLRNQTAFGLGPGLSADLSFDFADYAPVRSAAGGFDSVLDGDVSIFNTFTEKRQIYGGALRLHYEGALFDVTSITAARGFDFENAGSDFTAMNLFFLDQELSRLQFSQELRFSGAHEELFDWTAGAFFFGQGADLVSQVQLNNAAFGFGLAPGHAESSLANQQTWSAASFGEITWHLSDDLDLTAGLRAGYDRAEIDYNYVSNDGLGLLAPPQTRRAGAGFTSLGGRLGIAYEAMPGVIPYATISRTSKPGGFNTVQLPAGPIGFGRETATNYEVGLKSIWFDGRLVANAAAFQLDRRDQQVQNLAAFGATTVNADKSRSRGVEVTLAGRPAPGLDLSAGYAFIDSEFINFPNFPAAGFGSLDLSGNDIPFASKNSFSLGVSYVRPLSEEVRLVFRGDYAYQSGFFFDAANSLRQSGYGLLSARLGLAGDNWGLYLWGKNLANKKYRVSAVTDAILGATAIAGDPRVLGIEGRIRF